MKLISKGNWTHYLALLVGVLACAIVIEFFAVDRCLDNGGRVADSGWSCEVPSGAVEPLLQYVAAWLVATIIVVVGVPVYFMFAAMFQGLFVAGGQRDG